MARRYGSVIKVKPEKIDEYRRLHANAWPGVLKVISRCNIRNYSIFLRQLDDGQHYLFSYYEYVGDDYQADMARMAADPTTQEWWAVCNPCQEPLATREPDEWWSAMDTVFYFQG